VEFIVVSSVVVAAVEFNVLFLYSWYWRIASVPQTTPDKKAKNWNRRNKRWDLWGSFRKSKMHVNHNISDAIV